MRRARLDRRAPARGCCSCLEQALAWGQKHAADRLAGQASIFDLGGPAEEEQSRPKHHPVVPPGEFEKPELLQLEKETLGLYVSEHPLHAVRDQLRRKTDCTLAELERRRDGEVVTVGGIVSAVKQLTTKKGEPMVFLTLDDLTGGGEVVVFNSTYATARELCVTERILVVKGRVDHKQQGETKLHRDGGDGVRGRAGADGGAAAGSTRARRGRGSSRSSSSSCRSTRATRPSSSRSRPRMGPKTLALGPKHRVTIDSDFLTDARMRLGADAVL